MYVHIIVLLYSYMSICFRFPYLWKMLNTDIEAAGTKLNFVPYVAYIIAW